MIKKTIVDILLMIQAAVNETTDRILMIRQQDENDAYIRGFQDGIAYNKLCNEKIKKENLNK